MGGGSGPGGVVLRVRLIPRPLLRKRRRGAFNEFQNYFLNETPWLPFSFSEKGPGDEAHAKDDDAGT
ncbi:hypothetical protein HBN54_001104 [Hymenobacter sp. 1B]|uniref:Uncharacterized protein n=1 Tax=Hymenobacter artigasi TaxID=2719616 RepID=A0ABX1HH84_9BACT|nr:hypothetical protein [Hymenobacter artigasi]